MRFGFGRNWQSFVANNFNEERLRIAQKHLLSFLGVTDLWGRTFLDIGCGSGIHSLAAWKAGADVFSFDYDPDSVSASKSIWQSTGGPRNWHIERGDVLDENYIRSIGQFDIVYSWGVLHHTGNMWAAVECASIPLKPQGLFYIALYSKENYPEWERWLKLKRRYNDSGIFMKRWLEWLHAWRTTIRDDLENRRNPFKTFSEYKRSRGMSYWTDVRDWVGGWPMEFAGHDETITFCKSFGLSLAKIKTGEGNTEYLFMSL